MAFICLIWSILQKFYIFLINFARKNEMKLLWKYTEEKLISCQIWRLFVKFIRKGTFLAKKPKCGNFLMINKMFDFLKIWEKTVKDLVQLTNKISNFLYLKFVKLSNDFTFKNKKNSNLSCLMFTNFKLCTFFFKFSKNICLKVLKLLFFVEK